MKIEIGEKVTIALSLPTTVMWANRGAADLPPSLAELFPRLAGKTGEVVGYCSCGCKWPQVIFNNIPGYEGPYSLPYEVLETQTNPLTWPE